MVSQQDLPLRICCWVSPSGSWFESAQYSVTGWAAGVHVPEELSVPASPRLCSMMQKLGFAAVAHSAGNWYWTQPSLSVTGDCEKAVATVTDVAVFAVMDWRSSVEPNFRIAWLPASAFTAKVEPTSGIVLLSG